MSTETAIELLPVQGLSHPPLKDGTNFLDRMQPRVSREARDSTAESLSRTNILPKGRSYVVIAQLCSLQFLQSFSNGLLIIGLPTIAQGLSIPSELLSWPTSVYSLTCASCFLVAGTITDVVGPRKINLTGCVFFAAFMLSCGLSRNGSDLILFRALQGIAWALLGPSSISIVSSGVESGTRRNLAFSLLGLCQPLGFSFGLVLGGVFVDTVGWRTGYYIGGAASFLLLIVGVWALPSDPPSRSEASIWRRLGAEIDWVGALLASAPLAMISYVLAVLSASTNNIKQPTTIALLVLSFILFSAFSAWMHWQVKRGRPALIPNTVWKSLPFTSITVMIMLSNGICNAQELFTSLFFQKVQTLPALQASLRILPSLVVGVVTNFTTGIFVDRVPVFWAVLIANVLAAGSSLLMSVIDPRWPYWYDAFFAQVLAPLSVDVLFTVGLLIVSDTFPPETQGLAGAVFNTFSQLGVAVSLAIFSVISTAVTDESPYANKTSSKALMDGYRATFWTSFAFMVTVCFMGAVGLRKLGKIGIKRD